MTHPTTASLNPVSFSMFSGIPSYSGKIRLQGAVILADAHLEKGRCIEDMVTPAPDRSIIVCGDLTRAELTNSYEAAMRWLSANFYSVVLIPGNHEYYTNSPLNSMCVVNEYLRSFERKYSNVHVFVNDVFTCDGVVCYAGTFWSKAKKNLFKNLPIYVSEGKAITFEDYDLFHETSVSVLYRALKLAKDNNLGLMIFTHYAPSIELCIDPNCRNQHMNCMYATDFTHLVNESCVLAWVYGHTGYNGRAGKITTNQYGKRWYSKNGYFI